TLRAGVGRRRVAAPDQEQPDGRHKGGGFTATESADRPDRVGAEPVPFKAGNICSIARRR
ncbi:hypothetical protein, partial [Mesorhizobium sp.]|uniref:hypothetical protein n=1 Tax=Mesorhizobium sp. TaxID=1871066 RepID=UPI0025BEE189